MRKTVLAFEPRSVPTNTGSRQMFIDGLLKFLETGNEEYLPPGVEEYLVPDRARQDMLRDRGACD